MGFKIGIIGPLNIDFIIRGEAPQDIQKLNSWTGPSEVYCLTAGAAGYISQNLKKLENNIHLVSCVGDDPFGLMILNTLKTLGINPDYIQVEMGTEGAIAIFMLLFGNIKRPLTYRLPTHHGWPIKLETETIQYLLDVDLLHTAGYLHFPDLWNDDFLSLFKEAKAKGIMTSMDPQFPLSPLEIPWISVLKSLVPYIDILMVDENEALSISGKDTIESAANFLLKEGFKKIVIKLGPKGAFIKDKNIEQLIPALFPERFVDTIGAGDSFDAGFLQGILEEMSLQEATKMGIKAATMSIEGVGGTETFPLRTNLKL